VKQSAAKQKKIKIQYD